jgi:hypothetical protein
MTALGVIDLEAPEHDFQSSNMVGAWRGHGVKVAYYTDPAHGVDPKRSGVKGDAATIELAGHRVVKVDWQGFPSHLLRAKCRGSFYEVTVFDGLDPFAASPDDDMTAQFMTALLKSPACS